MGLKPETEAIRRMRMKRKDSDDKLAIFSEKKTLSSPSLMTIIALRTFWVILIFISVTNNNAVQMYINQLWEYLLTTSVFHSVYFETLWATLCYAIILAVPFAMDHIPFFDRYKIDPRLVWQSAGIKKIAWEAVIYCVPLMTLDTFLVKKYSGVEVREWEWRSKYLLQTTRALPVHPPTPPQMATQLAASFVLYDLLFFMVHFTLHTNRWLYKHVHASHHEHDVMFSRVTNQLTVTERIALVLAANQALKLVNSHPLTRTIFVPLFIAMLVENHCGYNLPFTLDKVVPFGLFGGSARHYEHHIHGSRNYQPFFTYIDRIIDAVRQRKKT